MHRMNEVADEDVIYEDIQDKADIIDISSEEEEEFSDSAEEIKKEVDELRKYKKNKISYYKRFYTNKSIYCVNSHKKWIYFGSINNKCYLYDDFDKDIKNFASNISSSEGEFLPTGESINLQGLKQQKYSDTVTNIIFSRTHKYVALSIYNGDIYVYENNNMNSSEILSYEINNVKQNINNSNSLVNIYQWNVDKGNMQEEEIIDDMKFVNILSMNNSGNKMDIEYFMFCPYNENIILSIYLNSPNIYIWNVLEEIPINITHTVNIPTFLNVCNYGNSFYIIVGFHGGETIVYDYDIYNLKRKNENKKGEKNQKLEHREGMGRANDISYIDSSDDVLCIDNSISNEIYVATHENVIRMYNLKSNNVIATFANLHNDLVDYCLVNNKKNNLFASSSLDNKIVIFDMQSKKHINQFHVNYHFGEICTGEENTPGSVVAKMEKGINFLKWVNANILLFSSLNGNIYIYDIRLRKCVHQFYCHTDTIFNVHVSLHLYEQKQVLSILTASDDNSSNLHFLDLTPLI
ncbi:WD repeat-containing protein, putative [Plasmodium ovale wallikeri]|uniref:WD repeat-containing protein, putative n=2 Tax=Plasmodium ovale TaxID=36330 RepID=A0A1A8YP95_PLAOA|nr:WD repeat-containing protein, putative [Plasmodium ovale wallikeri]SBT33358.1 WD repeat-containing protein, putative [Plasmodium ovale wallikeri]SBT76122.1 WD repeat-containing protein, putative [Plasmodium ovale]